MKTPNDLFDLIRSMSTSEKRYFKIYASRHGKNVGNSVKLFDAIEAQDRYDEDSIRHQFREERFARQLPVQKSYLYDMILRSLREYHHGCCAEVRLREMLTEVEILFARGLNRQCLDHIARCRTLAASEESFEHLLATLAWEIRVCQAEHDTARLRSAIEERERVVGLMENAAAYSRISLELLELERSHGWLADARARQALERIKAEPLMADVACARTFGARLLFLNAWDVACALDGDDLGAYEYARRYLEAIEERPEWCARNVRRYVAALSNAAGAALRVQKLEEMWAWLDTLGGIQTDSIELRAHIAASVHHHTLDALTLVGDFREAVTRIPAVTDALTAYGAHMAPASRKTLVYLVAYARFGVGENSAALELLQDILNETRNETRQDIQKAARMLALIIHFELGNCAIIPYQVRSAKRMLANREQLDELDRALLALLNRLSAATSARERRLVASHARDRIMPMLRRPREFRILEYIDLERWIAGVCEGVGFANATRVPRLVNGPLHEQPLPVHVPRLPHPPGASAAFASQTGT